MKKVLKLTGIFALSMVMFTACSTEDLEPTLAQSKPVEGSITSVGNLYSIIKGVHSQLSGSGYWGGAMILTNEVRSDNCFSNGNSGRYSTQAEFAYNSNTGYVWDNCYSVIANTNIIINEDLSGLSGDLAYGEHIQGQATAIRALAHFDLLRSFGQQHTSGGSLGVPIILQFKDESNLFPSRNSIDEVKAAIYADLEAAFNMMSTAYDSKIFMSKYAAKALESRVALYFGDWARARDAAQAVLDTGNYSIESAAGFVGSFAVDQASNSIFEIENSNADNAGNLSVHYLYRFPTDAPSGYGDVEVVSGVAGLFEATDVRGTAGILGYQDGGTRLRNMGKYPDTLTRTDNVPLIRIEEVILNLAEALFEINNADPMALTHLNSIPANRGASAYAAATKANILLERRKELMFEGFRFDDMMRTGQSIDALGSNQNLITTLTYPNNLFAYPIPLSEMNANSNMVQNAGY